MFIYYVYAYLRKDGSPYYIGKGKGRRAYEKEHTVNLPTDKSRIVFLEKGLSEWGALALERRYIKWYGRKDLGTGILRNKTDGGEGVSGIVVSQETRGKLSRASKGKLIGNKNPMFGKTGKASPNFGIVRSIEFKIKVSLAKKLLEQNKGANNPRSRKVMCEQTGEVFAYGKLAAEWAGISNTTLCGNLKGYQKSAGKHPLTGEKLTWKYL